MGKYLHRYLNQSDFETDYNDETTPKYIEPWVSATNDEDKLRVDYNKRRIIFEFDTQVTESVKFSSLDDSWSTSTPRPVYPITGGDVNDLFFAMATGAEIKYIAHNYLGHDETFEGDSLTGKPDGLVPNAFGLTCPYGFMYELVKKTGTNELYLMAECQIG